MGRNCHGTARHVRWVDAPGGGEAKLLLAGVLVVLVVLVVPLFLRVLVMPAGPM